MPAKKKVEGETLVLSVRVSVALAKRLDAIAISHSKPGLVLSRGDAARMALETGTTTLEKEVARKPKK